MNSELIKFTEVKHKRLSKATPMERKELIFAENSYNLCAVELGNLVLEVIMDYGSAFESLECVHLR